MRYQADRYARVAGHWAGPCGVAGWWVLPPDVELPPERAGDGARRLLCTHMRESDRAAALLGVLLGELVGDVILRASNALGAAREHQAIGPCSVTAVSRLRPVRIQSNGRLFRARRADQFQRW